MKCLINRRKLVKAMGIPEEYQEVTQIGPKNVSAICYVDTKFMPNQDTRVVTKVMRTVESTHSTYYGTESPRFTFLKNRVDYNEMQKFAITQVALNTPIIIDHNRNYVTINGTHHGPIADYAQFTCVKPLTLQCLNGYLQSSVQFGGRTYYFKLYDNDVLIRDFVPCYRKEDGAIGFYCRVTKKFYQPTDASKIVTKGEDVI